MNSINYLQFNQSLNFRDYQGEEGIYEATAIVKHEGGMTADGEAQGHYICDVKSKVSEKWFRTNDNQIPVPIFQQNVTKSGIVILFQKKD